MLWFTKKKPLETIQSADAEKTAIEIVAHKNAKQEVVEDARRANEQLNKLLVGNGFTLKIYLAAGGNHPNRNKG